MDLKLRGKRALVTGSSRGIGRAIALSPADIKVDVAINYLRNRARAEETAHEIESRGVRSLVLKGNVANPDHVERIFGAIRDELLDCARGRTPAGRLVNSQDVANVAIFLCTQYASMIQGQTLVVDGGYSILA